MGKRILVVDDAPSVRMLVRLSLSRAGYAVDEAVDGEDALNHLSSPPYPDLVVTDLNMPKQDGIALLRKIRAGGPVRFVPVIIFTSPLEPEKRREAREAGASAWIEKPFKPDALQRLIRRFIGLSGV